MDLIVSVPEFTYLLCLIVQFSDRKPACFSVFVFCLRLESVDLFHHYLSWVSYRTDDSIVLGKL